MLFVGDKVGAGVCVGRPDAIAAFHLGPPRCQVCQALGITKPAALGWAQNNKVTVVIMTFLASSMAGQLTATGAFEISYGGTRLRLVSFDSVS